MSPRVIDDFIRRWYDDWFTINRIYVQWAQQKGLTDTTLFLLWAIDEYAMRRNEECTLRFLCDKLSLPKQTVASALDGLESKKLLERLPGSKDKRNRLIRFTAEGKIYADQILREMQAAERAAFNEFDRYRLESVTNGYHRMTALLEKHLSTSEKGEESHE